MIGGHLRRAADYLLAIPIHVKVLGIVSVALVAMGSVTVVLACHAYGTAAASTMARFSREKTSSLAARAERLLITGDTLALGDLLRRERDSNPDLRYAVVYDAAGRVVAHAFPGRLPEALARTSGQPAQRPVVVRGELVFDTWAPVLEGRAGRVRMGIGTRLVERQVEWLGQRLWIALGLCLLVALAIASVVTKLMTGSLRRLVIATERIGDGDLAYRAPVGARDEVGDLTLSFNGMATRLERQRRELDSRERERTALHDRILHLQEGERRRIAQDLHDDLGSSLAAILLQVQERSRTLSRGASIEAGSLEDWSRMEAQVTGLLRRVRWLYWNLRPPELQEGGLGRAIAQLVDDLPDELGVTLDCCCDSSEDDLPPLPAAVELALFRIAQEAIANALRHAGASRISVVVMQHVRVVTLLVEDDGCGFDPAEERTGRRQLGLTGMRERVTALGGTLYLHSELGQGTIVRVAVPLPPSAPAPSPLAATNPVRRSADPDAGFRPAAATPCLEPTTPASAGQAPRRGVGDLGSAGARAQPALPEEG